MSKLTFYAGLQSHFVDFLAPLWFNLPPKYRGDFHARSSAYQRAEELNIPVIGIRPKPSDIPVIVASFEDYNAMRPAPVVLVNHGSGQTYNGDPDDKTAYRHRAYSGGYGRERVVLNLCPSEPDAAINRHYYPDAVSVACGPWKLDPWFWEPPQPVSNRVVISFHLDAQVCPETHWSFPYYQQAITDIAKSGKFDLYGHSHPRARVILEPFWEEIGVGFIRNFDDVLNSAALYVCDNSSSLYEAAAIGIPVLVLNSPGYRRNISHGLRFWSHVPGLEVNTPQALGHGIAEALADPPFLQQKRESAVSAVYAGSDGKPLLDGCATERAVQALVDLARDHAC